jgi:hypothetical protein
MLSGAAGQLYGSAFTWRFPPGWRENLDTPGILELSYMKKLFIARKWYELIPDQEHTTLVAGYGQFSARGSISTDSYAAAARTADGNLGHRLYSLRADGLCGHGPGWPPRLSGAGTIPRTAPIGS